MSGPEASTRLAINVSECTAERLRELVESHGDNVTDTVARAIYLLHLVEGRVPQSERLTLRHGDLPVVLNHPKEKR